MHIRWTDPAVRDFTHICDYIQKHGSEATARRVALSIHDQLAMLSKFPECGRTGRKPDTRELVFGNLPYLAVYRINRDAVEILRILHGAQDWSK
ncbi:MAG: type II toxin-antitoxin system RelE/ParE family toxin [Acidobacteriia bacterium]|nr:type II toxin-antitoxin system RelE/ParE family toxin [Terriglobia bacterium]